MNKEEHWIVAFQQAKVMDEGHPKNGRFIDQI